MVLESIYRHGHERGRVATKTAIDRDAYRLHLEEVRW